MPTKAELYAQMAEKVTTQLLKILNFLQALTLLWRSSNLQMRSRAISKKHLTRRSRRTSPTNNHIGGKHNAKGNHR